MSFSNIPSARKGKGITPFLDHGVLENLKLKAGSHKPVCAADFHKLQQHLRVLFHEEFCSSDLFYYVTYYVYEFFSSYDCPAVKRIQGNTKRGKPGKNLRNLQQNIGNRVSLRPLETTFKEEPEDDEEEDDDDVEDEENIDPTQFNNFGEFKQSLLQ